MNFQKVTTIVKGFMSPIDAGAAQVGDLEAQKTLTFGDLLPEALLAKLQKGETAKGTFVFNFFYLPPVHEQLAQHPLQGDLSARPSRYGVTNVVPGRYRYTRPNWVSDQAVRVFETSGGLALCFDPDTKDTPLSLCPADAIFIPVND